MSYRRPAREEGFFRAGSRRRLLPSRQYRRSLLRESALPKKTAYGTAFHRGKHGQKKPSPGSILLSSRQCRRSLLQTRSRRRSLLLSRQGLEEAFFASRQEQIEYFRTNYLCIRARAYPRRAGSSTLSNTTYVGTFRTLLLIFACSYLLICTSNAPHILLLRSWNTIFGTVLYGGRLMMT